MLFLLFVLLGLIFSGCGHVLYSDGPYIGKIIDKETHEPIEGAAVLAVWGKQTPRIAEAQWTYYDAQNTVTDKDGNFTIPGIIGGSINPMAKIREPLFTIFKPGYEAYKARRMPLPNHDGIKLLELRPLTTKTRNEKIDNMSGVISNACTPDRDPEFCIPQDKFVDLIKLMNIEEKQLGLGPTYLRK